jgi:hypothetical protein
MATPIAAIGPKRPAIVTNQDYELRISIYELRISIQEPGTIYHEFNTAKTSAKS